MIDGQSYLSVYQSGQITKPKWIIASAKITAAFKGIDEPFTNILKEQFFKMKFTDEKMMDAVDYVIQNCQYPNPTIANFISFDRLKKLYNYHQACDYINRYGGDLEQLFDFITVDTKKFFTLKSER